MKPESTATDICENILKQIKRSHVEKHILPNEIEIIDRLLARRFEMREAYVEIVEKLNTSPHAVAFFIACLLPAAAFLNPDEASQLRTYKKQLSDLNKKISELSRQLSEAIDRRADLHSISDFSSGTHFDICEVIENAASNNSFYNSFIKDKLRALNAQYFHAKYWPSLTEIFDEISRDASAAEITSTHPLVAGATKNNRPSLADFVRALLISIDMHREKWGGLLPDDFTLTDNTLATITNCALDLGADKLVDGPYVKRLRQRERETPIK